MKANRKFNNDEDAVSPVIGVILMVAITVILAAVIASFVFGMSSSLKKPYNIAATASQQGSTITAVFNGGPDADQVDYLNATIGSNSFSTAGTDFASNSTGSIATTTGTSGYNDHVIVVANFNDGTSQIILDTFV